MRIIELTLKKQGYVMIRSNKIREITSSIRQPLQEIGHFILETKES